MVISIADVFRTRQALRDLSDAVGMQKDALLDLGKSGAERESITRILDAGCKIELPRDVRAYSLLLLAAALPEENFPAFTAATALLVIDRLKSGGGSDDLYWNWEAFQDHYRLADPPMRAALMNGFRALSDQGLVKLGSGPSQLDCLTRTPDDILSMLEGTGLDDLIQAIKSDASAEQAGALWARISMEKLPWQGLAGFRLLYERPASIAPPDPEHADLIPAA